MSRVSLELLKQQVHAEDFEGDDALLNECLLDAEQQVLDMIGWTADEVSGIPDNEFPRPLKRAILVRASTLYRYREDTETQQTSQIPLSTQALLKPYSRLCGGGLMETLVAKYPPEGEGS